MASDPHSLIVVGVFLFIKLNYKQHNVNKLAIRQT